MREAIDRLTQLGQQTFRQANAAQHQLTELRRQTEEMGRQTGALSSTATSTTVLAGATVEQLSQRDRQFSLEQQPDVRWDPESSASRDFLSDDPRRGIVLWSYGIKNFGKSAAHDLVSVEGISLFGRPFAESRRPGARRFGPGATAWSTAVYPIGSKNLPIPLNAMPVLRVVFTYRDASGRKYSQMLCHRLDPPNGAPRECDTEPVAKLPGRPLEIVAASRDRRDP
jgi:hypothetical protein